MENFLGKWEMVSNENGHEFLKAIGSKFKFGKATLEFQKTQGDGLVQIVSSDYSDNFVHTILFEHGKEVKHTTLDGEESTSVITINGNTMIQVQEAHNKKVTTTRVVEGDTLTTTYEVDGILPAKAIYKKVLN